MEDIQPCVHFVGFKGDEYHSAVAAFGKPDFIHRYWDGRAESMVIKGIDVVVFANGARPVIQSKFSFDDSEVM